MQPLLHTYNHTQIHKHVHSWPTGLLFLSPEVQDSEEQRVLSHCDQLIGLKLSKHTITHTDTHSAGVAVEESTKLPWWWGVMSQHLPEKKGAAGMLFILQNVRVHTTLAPVTVRKYNVPDIFTFCSQLTFHRKAPAISLYTWRIIPAEALEMCSTREAKQGGLVTNLGTHPPPHTQIDAVFSVNNNN